MLEVVCLNSRGKEFNRVTCKSMVEAHKVCLGFRMIETVTAFNWYARTGNMLEPCKYVIVKQ